METEGSASFESLFRDHSYEDSRTVFPLVKKCLALSQDEAELVRALEMALCHCLKSSGPGQLEELLQVACPTAESFVSNKLKHLEKTPGAYFECLAVVLKVIAYFKGVFEYLNGSEKPTDKVVKSLLMAACEILYGCYSHCKISEEVYGSLFDSAAECLNNFFKNCCSLLEQILNFISEKCESYIDGELLLLDEVLTYLSKLGIILIHLEVKAMAKVWKTFAFLVQKYLEYLKKSHDIGETIRELSCTIMSNVEAGLYKEGENISTVTRSSVFLLKLVVKFCEEFKGCLKGCQQTLLNLLLLLCKCDAQLMDKSKMKEDVNESMLSQLTIGIEPLMSNLMTDEKLIDELQKVANDCEKSAEFVILLCLILKRLIMSDRETRNLWFNEERNILSWVFQAASLSKFALADRPQTFSTFTDFKYSPKIHLPNILVKGKYKKFSDLYEYLVVSTCSFLCTALAYEYDLTEKILIQNVLQRDPIRAVLAIDIWCLLARYADSSLCLSQMIALGRMLQEFHPGTSRPEKWYLESLVQRLFPLLLESHKAKFLKAFQPPFYSALWQGSTLNGLAPSVASDICSSLLAEVDHLLGHSSDGASDWERVKEKAGRSSSLMYERFGEKIGRLWKFDCEVLSSSPLSVRFLRIMCLLTACVVSEMPSETLFLVLSQMKRLVALEQPTAVILCLTCILRALAHVSIPPSDSQKEILAAIADVFRLLLTSAREVVKEKALDTFFSFAHATSHAEIISLSVRQSSELKLEVAEYFKKKPPDTADTGVDDYIRELCRLRFEHVCEGEEELVEAVASKKLKTWAISAEEMVVRWKEDGRKIVEYYEELSNSQKEEVKQVCSSILSLS